MTVNVPLLRKVLEHITAHPEEHEQDIWAVTSSCGTVACLAGHVVAMSGLDFDWRPPTTAEVTLHGAMSSADRTTTGREIPDVAAELLGLTDEEAGDLFYAENLDELWSIADAITDGEIRDPRP